MVRRHTRMLILSCAAGLGALFGGPLAAQTTAPGHRMVSVLGDQRTPMLDRNGVTVHSWNSAFAPGLGTYVDRDGTLLRAINVRSIGVPGGFGGGVQRLALDGTVVWDYRHGGPTELSHHDIHPMPNGNVLLTVWEDKTAQEAIAAGRTPALMAGNVFRPDAIVEVQPTGPTSGVVVWRWSSWDHLVQDADPTKANFGSVGQSPGRIDINFPAVALEANDWNHVNGIEYDPIDDWIIVSAHHQSEIWIIDHSTTTAEAAGSTGGRRGRGGELLYRWGNPQAYRAGGPNDQQLFGQHDPRVIPAGCPGAGHVTLFNNQWSLTQSAVFEIALPVDASGQFTMGPGGRYGPTAPLWSYTAAGFYSPITSSAERLPNGNTLVCSGAQGWVFELDPNSQIIWQWRSPPTSPQLFHAHYVERTAWSDRGDVSASAGGAVQLDLLAGSPRAGDAYLLLGTFAGAGPGFTLGGVQVPLNPDPFLLYTASSPNQGPLLTQTFGFTDQLGRGTAQLTFPPGLLPAALIGQRLDVAFLLANPTLTGFTDASQAVGIDIGN